jgi:hypothetical protein
MLSETNKVAPAEVQLTDDQEISQREPLVEETFARENAPKKNA